MKSGCSTFRLREVQCFCLVFVTVVGIEVEVGDDLHRSIRQCSESIPLEERVSNRLNSIKVELVGEIAPNLSTVEVLDDQDGRLVRRCVDTNGNEWMESCTRWEEQNAYAVAVDVEHSDFHRRLFARFEGEWRVAVHDDHVRITIAFEFEPRYGLLGALITTFFRYKVPGIVEAIFDRWEAEIQSRATDTTEDDRPEPHSQRNVNALYR